MIRAIFKVFKWVTVRNVVFWNEMYVYFCNNFPKFSLEKLLHFHQSTQRHMLQY